MGGGDRLPGRADDRRAAGGDGVTQDEDTYVQAAGIADRLLAQGLPLLGFASVDLGAKALFTIQDGDGRCWAFRVPRENLKLESVEEMVRAYL